MEVKILKLHKDAVSPTYGSPDSAGADLYSVDDEILFEPNETKFIHTGIALEIPTGYVGLVYARSGLACKRSLAPANKVGVIDSDYRGEIIVALHNHSLSAESIEKGERIAHLVITPYLKADFAEVLSLSDTERGSNGFGSTGKK